MTDRFKRSSWQRALCARAISPLLSIWLDFPATAWLKSLQQQHFISAHCEIDFTRLQFVCTDQKWLSRRSRVLMSQKGHSTAVKGRKTEYQRMKKSTPCCDFSERSKNMHSLQACDFTGRCIEILHLHWTMSEMCMLPVRGSKYSLPISVIHTEGSIEYNSNIVDCNSCLSTASNTPFNISLVMKRDFQTKSCLQHLLRSTYAQREI